MKNKKHMQIIYIRILLNNYLKTLTITKGDNTKVNVEGFSGDKVDYEIHVDSNTEKITLAGTTVRSDASISGIGTKVLVEGENKYVLSVKANNGDVRNYNIKVVKAKKEGTIIKDADTIIKESNLNIDGEYITGLTLTTDVSYIKNIINKYPCPDVNSGFYVEERRWNILLRNIMKHKNTMLVGPTGTGKTDVIIRICKALNIPCRIYDMGAMMDPLTDLLGSHRLENGTSKFDYAKFVYDVQEPGVILLDELSRAPQMTNNILFPCLDDRRTLPVEIADSNGPREIHVHPECTFIATANIGSEYSGTNELDAALENRFMTIQVDYLPKSIETQILTIRTGCDERSAMKIVGVANAIRERYLDGSLSKTISTRETLTCGELIVDGFSLLEAVNFSFCEKFPKYGENSEYDTVKKIMMGF